jgi:ribonuclease BN (tRNA processing enzyme)
MKLVRRRFLHLATGLVALPAVSLVAAAQTSPAPSNTGSRLITLGTASGPIPRPHRAQSSNLLTVNGTRYVIDAGDGVVRRLAKAGVDVRDVGTIFLTHHHDDHTAGLGWLMASAWDQNRIKPIHVYGPPQTEALVKAAVQYFGISAQIRIADGGVTVPIAQVFIGHDVGSGIIYQDANIKVSAVENSHYHFHSGNDVGKHQSYAYRFETPDRVVVFTGDTGASDAVTELANGADVLVTQTSSFKDRMQTAIANGRWQSMTLTEQARLLGQAKRNITLEEIGKMATRANVKIVVLSHLSARADGSDDYTPWVAEVKEHFSGEVHVAKDLMEF